MPETLLSPSNILLFGRVVTDLQITAVDHSPFIVARTGGNRDLETQLTKTNPPAPTIQEPIIARIYSFSYEGAFYDLPRPALFLVHGNGFLVTNTSPKGVEGNAPRRSNAPGEPSLTGVGAADFQFADEIRAWSYDKADHTIRMDVETGEFEDVLLNMFFGGGGPSVSGSKVQGIRPRRSVYRLSGGRGDAND
jgi:hypothetical protein